MKIPFENWIIEQSISEDAKLLFEESIMCYRVSAYRAAYLMSYLGFFQELRERLVRSETPNLMEEGEDTWYKLKKRLTDEDKWEGAVYQATQMKTSESDYVKSKSKVFLISNDIIEDIPFWRRKRNECAHAKDTYIGNSHVEMFWQFLQSNLPKFVVNGGKAALMDKLKKHFDSKYTKPGTDFTHLIEEIPLVVKGNELPELLSELYIDYIDLYPETEQYKFWRTISNSSNRELQNGFLEFITSDNDTFAEFMEAFPDKLMLCADKEELLRLFWNELLFEYIGNRRPSFWDLAISLLTNEVVPIDEQEDFVLRLSHTLRGGTYPNEHQTSILQRYDLFSAIRRDIFVSGKLNKVYTGYETANANDQKIIYYLENTPLDEKVVKELNRLFKSYSFGNLYRQLERYKNENIRFLSKLYQIAEESNIELADFFKGNILEESG